MAKRRRRPIGQTIGGILFGFEQQVLRTAPPAEELVHHARPDAPVPAGDGTLVTIGMPEPLVRSSAAAWPAADTDTDTDTDTANTDTDPDTAGSSNAAEPSEGATPR